MDNFDKVYSYLTEEEGLSPEDASRAMVMMVEQGFDPTQVFLGGLAKMLDFLPKKKVNPVKVAANQPPAPKPAFSSVGTTTVKPQQGPALSTRVAPAPQFGGSPQAQDIKRLNQLTKGPIGDKTIQKPVVSSGRMGTPQGPKLSTNVAPKPKFATSMTPAPKPNFSTVKPPTPQRNAGGPISAVLQALTKIQGSTPQSGPAAERAKAERETAIQAKWGKAMNQTPSRFGKAGPDVPKNLAAPSETPKTPEKKPEVKPVAARVKVNPPVKQPEKPKVDPEVQRYRQLIKQGKRLEAEKLGREIYQRTYGAPAFRPTKTA